MFTVLLLTAAAPPAYTVENKCPPKFVVENRVPAKPAPPPVQYQTTTGVYVTPVGDGTYRYVDPFAAPQTCSGPGCQQSQQSVPPARSTGFGLFRRR